MQPNKYADIPPDQRAKAKTFFEKAAAVAATGNFDYSVEMFLSGLTIDPESIEAHQALRDVGLRRKASGGKGPGMFASISGKTDKERMLSAEKNLALDPGERKWMAGLLEHAFKCGYFDTALWIAAIFYKANNEHPKPDFGYFDKVRDHYVKLERWPLAVEVTQRMLQMRSDDMDLKNELKNLSARDAMERGKYDSARSFRDSIRDADKQRDLLESEKDHSGEDFLQKQLRDAEAQLAADPREIGKMTRVIDALLKFNLPEYDQKAVDRSNQFYDNTGQYRFRLQAHRIRLKQLTAEFRRLQKIAIDSKTPESIEALKAFQKTRAQEELGIFQEAADQYPTENTYKYEVANRLVNLERFDEAIPIFQQVVGDPKLRTDATLKLGQTFLAAGFNDEAADTLKVLMEAYQVTGDDRAKEIYYWHGRAEEARGDTPTALKSYSQIVKWDFNYKDVQTRIKKLRAGPAAT